MPPLVEEKSRKSQSEVKETESRVDIESLRSRGSDEKSDDSDDSSASNQSLDDRYNRFSPARKLIITIVLSYCGFLTPISSTTVLSAVPEVAETFHTDGTTITTSNALYMLFMGLSPLLWGPLSQVYGRRPICLSTAILFFAFSIGTALSPNLVGFYMFRILTAFQGTSFLNVGASCIGDIYRPTERATALAWFMSGMLIGPALGPFIGGTIITFRSWRVIFWLQTALGGLGTVLVFFLLPETIHHRRCDEWTGLARKQKAREVWRWTNPWRVLSLFKYPNVIAAGIASAALVWNMYSLLTPIRYVLNPRFDLDSPILSGLFYLAPGCGYLTGTFFGGRWADHTVKKWIKIRGGERVAEDRLRSCIVFMGLVIPGAMLVYGWTVQMEKGGVAVPVIMMFVQGVAQLFCFPSVNTYCLDVMQERSGEVVAGNYMVRFLFAALGTGVVLPAVESIGIGGFSSISAGFLVFAAGVIALTTRYGRAWRERIDGRERRAIHGDVEDVENVENVENVEEKKEDKREETPSASSNGDGAVGSKSKEGSEIGKGEFREQGQEQQGPHQEPQQQKQQQQQQQQQHLGQQEQRPSQ
ncbi:MAG: hypothetical protein M1819_001575 [Sarea resinae]|nr:MAG: hypothetical protein M1819_001575 [Sarea resinae]